jgi:hypothetical protein
MHALEVGAASGRSLDPATYALVDPDESVRSRAQEVLGRSWRDTTVVMEGARAARTPQEEM